jgi:LPXTG-site transpeptidase (sortase) family protein
VPAPDADRPGSSPPDAPPPGPAGPHSHPPEDHAVRRFWIGFAVSVAVFAAAGGVAVLVALGGDDEEGDGSPAELAREAGAGPGPAGEPSAPRGTAEPARAKLRVDPAKPIADGPRQAAPVHVAIPSAGIEAPVVPVHGGSEGVEVPPPERVGWYDGGPRPGEPGRAVLIGHRDSKTGPAVFTNLPSAGAGMAMQVTDAAGEVHRYEVVGTARVEKGRFPSADVFGTSEGSVLVLVTCGGPYDPDAGYRDNFLTYARAKS